MEVARIEVPIEIKTYDIDVAGHVNNIVYVRWIEDLRSRLMESLFPVSDLLEKHLYSVVTATRIRYRTQLKLGDKPDGSIWIDSVRHGIMHIKVVFRKAGVIIAAAEQNCVLMNLQTGKMDGEAMKVFLHKSGIPEVEHEQ